MLKFSKLEILVYFPIGRINLSDISLFSHCANTIRVKVIEEFLLFFIKLLFFVLFFFLGGWVGTKCPSYLIGVASYCISISYKLCISISFYYYYSFLLVH